MKFRLVVMGFLILYSTYHISYVEIVLRVRQRACDDRKIDYAQFLSEHFNPFNLL